MSVKLVSEVGVGTVAAGVAKANSDHVTIAGHDGGTGASPVSSIQSAGVPVEIGLAETQQTLVQNRLRDRITVQTDGQLKTGRDVIVGALLGAEEFGFSTGPLITMGCIMMRACHLNTCPVGIAAWDPELRKRFEGTPENVVNYFFYVAEEARGLMARLGVRRFEDLIGRTDLLATDDAIEHWKARGVDLSNLLAAPQVGPEVARRRVRAQDPVLDDHADHALISVAGPALERRERVVTELQVENKNRTVCGVLSGEIARRQGADGLPEDTISVTARGSGGQSFGGWLAPGVTITLHGDANDYTGKGLSGGVLTVRPPEGTTFVAEENVVVGNTVLYGATSGRAFLPGPGRRALRRAQLGRPDGRRGHGRPRLRVHDRRPGRRPRPDGAQLRRRHERRHGLRARPGGGVPRSLQPWSRRPRGLILLFTEGRPNALVALVADEVEVDTTGREGGVCLPVVAHPGDVGRVVGRVLPGREGMTHPTRRALTQR